MKYQDIELYIRKGYIAKLPLYEGIFKWDWGTNRVIMVNQEYVKTDIDEEKKRTDWYYII